MFLFLGFPSSEGNIGKCIEGSVVDKSIVSGRGEEGCRVCPILLAACVDDETHVYCTVNTCSDLSPFNTIVLQHENLFSLN